METWLHYTIVLIAGGTLVSGHSVMTMCQDWSNGKLINQESMMALTGGIMVAVGAVSLVAYVIVKSIMVN